ncbi:LacI family DNA-binding transcriptional regulator [Actinomyces provencensis]|uniref:LacI family DNA-binding transcriptional regulator n=1 Tax=Actinomyces provencensis TaxID=1720198 RepID=UPI00098F7BDD|nr:LacI family DNA-binding transcriptional regulator [Actinomyces provencensis]
MATRKEVAAAAGVSVRTVSNVVNEFVHVAPETRARVLRAIDELSYRPNELARSLKTGRSGVVGLMLPQLDNPYFAEITRALVQEGELHGLTVVIDQTDGDRDRELSWVQRARSGALFDALILSPLGIRPRDMDLLPRDVPVVFLGEDDYPGFDRVAVDSFAASREVGIHLAASGRRTFAAFGAAAADMGHEAKGTRVLRLDGFRAGLVESRIPEEDLLIVPAASFTRTDGHRVMTEILERGETPDAVFCLADPLALGALRALHEHGVRVPEDVAVVGFDDVEDVRFSTPSISSIRPDKSWIAETTIDRLKRRLGGEELTPETLWAPYQLVVRESSASLQSPGTAPHSGRTGDGQPEVRPHPERQAEPPSYAE